MTIGQIRVHQGLHMPSGGDPLPWLGTYPRSSSGDPGGIHMIGTLAERPAPSAGTQQGSDGFLSPTLTSFNSPSGRFSSAYSGETLTITDPQDFTTTSYTVTYVSNNQLALSSAYSGATGVTTGAPNPTVNWVLEGPPSNAGLLYYATDGTAGGGNTIQLAAGAMFAILDSTGAPIFEVRDDGTVHIQTGQTVEADL